MTQLQTITGRVIIPTEEQTKQYAVHGRTAFNLEEELRIFGECYIDLAILQEISPVSAYWRQGKRVQQGKFWGFEINPFGIIASSTKGLANGSLKSRVKEGVYIDIARELNGLVGKFYNGTRVSIIPDYRT